MSSWGRQDQQGSSQDPKWVSINQCPSRKRTMVKSTSNVMMSAVGMTNTIFTGHSHVSCPKNCRFISNSIGYCFRVGQTWYVNDIIGEKSGWMKATAGSSSQTSPPLKGWRYGGTNGNWVDDPDMECGKPSLPCMAVSVELSGKVFHLTFRQLL